jgi:glycosyltransferase involved in cell wall biosynthesis
MMRIAMLGQKGVPAISGGIEQVVDMLSRHLVTRGHEVIVYCRKSYHGRGHSSCCQGGLHRIFRPSIPTKHLDAITHTLASTVDVALRRADVVHYHAIGPAALAPLARFARFPVVVTIHGLDWQRAKWGRFARGCLRMSEWVASWAASKMTVVSPVLRDYYHQSFGVEAEYIPNGVVPIQRAAPHRIRDLGLVPGRYLLAASRVVPEKGLHYLIEAFTRTRHDVNLVIAGGGGLDTAYENQLRRCDDPRVVFTGQADRELLSELYSHAMLFVLPSDLEGMSVALLEAMSMQLPVLVSDIPENVAVVGDDAITFEAGDVDSLQHALDRLLTRPEQLESFGRRAATRAEQFQWPSVVDRLERLYQQCVGQPVASLAT